MHVRRTKHHETIDPEIAQKTPRALRLIHMFELPTLLGVSPPRIREMIARGEIKTIQVDGMDKVVVCDIVGLIPS